MNRAVRVLIRAEVRLYGEGIRLLLEREPDMEVVAASGFREDVVTQLTDLRPDVVVLDTTMPDGMASMQAIRRFDGNVKVVALGVAEQDRDIITCAEAGVSGYVTREGSAAELVATIRGAARGEALCSPFVTASLLRRVASLADSCSVADQSRLTPRQLQIVGLIDEGLSNKEIAGRLCIEVPTVKSHVHAILERLGARRRGEAAARLRAGAL